MATLREYEQLKNGTDVRGVASAGVEGEEVNLTPGTAENIAAAFCLFLEERTGKSSVRVAVGHDSRISAPALSEGVLRGIEKTGGYAVFTALSSTPSMFMLLKDESFACDGSVMITASHLPFNRNGLKFFTPEGGLSSEDVGRILARAAEGNFPERPGGGLENRPYLDIYAAGLVEKVREATGEEKPLAGKRILVDAGNGAGGFYAEKVLAPLGADTTGSQFLDPDGTFPNHIPNPENEGAMRSVCEAVKKNGADFGIIFDTDVDRAGAVDKNGEEINRNRLIALISAILLKEEPGTVVTDSVTSDGLTKFIEAHGGKHCRYKRGYKNVIDAAVRRNAAGEYTPLAIETSGHAALKENYFLDDGAYLVTRLLIALAQEAKAGRTLTDLIADLPEPKEAAEARLRFEKGCDFQALGREVIDELGKYAASLPYVSPAAENYEGVRLNFDEAHGNGWLLVRMSLHEPILPVNIESDSEGGTEKIAAALYDFLKAYPFLDLSPLEKLLGADPADAGSDEDKNKNNTEEPLMNENTEEAKTPAATETEPVSETTGTTEEVFAENPAATETEPVSETTGTTEEVFAENPVATETTADATDTAETAAETEETTEPAETEETAPAEETEAEAEETEAEAEETEPAAETAAEAAETTAEAEAAPAEQPAAGEIAEDAAADEESAEEIAEEVPEEEPAAEGEEAEEAAPEEAQKDENNQSGDNIIMDVQQTTINALRVLSAEAVEKAKSGHPGLPLGSAPIAYTLFQNFLKFNPRDVKWNDRDRFVLSAGHGSALDYSLLYLYGFDMTKEDLMNFRQLGSRTPGHPEYGVTPGIETTTGPLGQGIANGVGMALAEAHLAAKFNRPGYPVVDHYTYVLCGDGCLEEGISYEACSFAGTMGLGKLILLYDDNDITIEGDTDVTFRENIGARFAAQNWQVLHVDLITRPDDVEALSAAIEKAKARTDKPSIIICHTRIGYGSPLEGSEKSHGAPLGAENLQKTKEKLGWPCTEAFDCPEEVFAHCHIAADAGAEKEMLWKKMFAEYEYTYPDLAEEYKAVMENRKPDLATMTELFDFDGPMATRQTSSVVLNKIAEKMPQLMGGSADLASSNLSEMKDTESAVYGSFGPENYAGRNIHFGVREHAMAAISNGMQLHGGVQAYCATFFVFTDYCKPAIRLASLMQLPVTYILTHDSIGVGEDGPTHQPVEQLIALRTIPGIKVYRPADGKETAAAWISALTGSQPTALVLTRQALPQYEGSGADALKGGYVLEDCEGTPDVLLIGTGSEVKLCVEAKAKLAEDGVKARVISMPCIEEFEKQSDEYKESVLPAAVKARVCVEAGSPYSWYKYAGEKGEIVAMTGFGASGPAAQLFEKFGFTADNVADKAKASIARIG